MNIMQWTKTGLAIAGASCALLTTAQTTDFGMGFIAGEPTGLSIKGKLSERHAVDAALAWNLLGRGQAFRVHVDYLFHSYDVINVKKGRMPLYFGAGARTRFWNGDTYWHNGEWRARHGRADIAARFPVGVAYEFDGAPLDVFLEAAPTLGLLPATYFDVDAGLGMRFWF